jgi:cyanophycin synthetase
MQISEFRFLRCGNLCAPVSGAVISFTNVSMSERLNDVQLNAWLRCFPTSLRLSQADLKQPLALLIPRLLLAFTDQARLQPASARRLHQRDTSLQIWLPVDDHLAAQAAAVLITHMVEAWQLGKPPDATTARLWASLSSRFWNQTHAHLARAAQQLGIPFHLVDQGQQPLLQLGQGCQLRLFRETLTDRTPLFAQAAANKEALHLLLLHRGVPLPAQEVVTSLEQALAAAERIGWPVVLKPAAGGKGRGVWVGLSSPEALRQAWQSQDLDSSPRQLVQPTLPGSDHRLLVMEGQLLATAQRQPASLCSDGLRPLRQQIAALNADPERGVAYERLMNQVPVDGRLNLLLAEQGLSLDTTPAAGTPVLLSRAANISQGGTAIDCSEQVHPDNRRLAEDIAQLIGADALGLDFISQDIGVSWREGGTWLLEANLSPGLRPHLVANPQSDLCQRIVRRWLGASPQGRIPTALITGSVGKTTTSRMLAHVLGSTGLRVGLSSSTGMELDGEEIASGDVAGGGAALHLLMDRRVEALVAEIARGGLLKSGLGLERADVGAVLNVLDNHVGMEGIRSRDDLAHIKAVVAQAADRLLVLNADDPLVLAMAQNRDPASVALVGEAPGCAAWQAHRKAGHLAVSYCSDPDGWITLHWHHEELLETCLRDIPASDLGAIGTIAPAAAFTAALACGLKLQPSQILAGLHGFGCQPAHNNGRFETVIHEPWELVLSWADGPEAMASISRYALNKTATKPRRRVLLCSSPDTRPDDYVRKVGQETWGFDLVICAAWDERSGRAEHEVPTLLAAGVRSLAPDGPEVLVAGHEAEAVGVLAQQLQPGDFCVVCSFDTPAMRNRLLTTVLG